MEAFVNFCEDAIFEMTHASGLMAVEESGGGGKAREASYSYMSEEDEERYDNTRITLSFLYMKTTFLR